MPRRARAACARRSGARAARARTPTSRALRGIDCDIVRRRHSRPRVAARCDEGMRRGLSCRRGLSAVGARPCADVRDQRRGHAQRACRGARARASRASFIPAPSARSEFRTARRAAKILPSSSTTMVGPYKRSKFLAEQACAEEAARAGVPVVIVNPSTPIGPLDYKPTPTGRIIVDFLNRQDAGLSRHRAQPRRR